MSIPSISVAPQRSSAFSARGARPAVGFDQALAQGQLRRVEAKEFLFAEGDAMSHVYKIETGALALYKVLADGRRQVMGFAYPGDIVGLGVDAEYTMNAQAVKATRVRCLPGEARRQAGGSEPALEFQLY